MSSSPSIPAPEPSPSASAAPADVERAECAIDFAVTESWPGGFKVEATVLNLGAPLDGWELSWRFEGDEQVEDLWNGVVVARSEGVVVVEDAGHNARLGTGDSFGFGFVASGEASVAPAEFVLEGRVCRAGLEDPSDDDDGEPATGEPGAGVPASGDFYLHDVSRAISATQAASGEERHLLEKISGTPQAYWVADPSPAGAANAVRSYSSKAAESGGIGLLVLYAVPGRDCEQHSSGGVRESAYARWIDEVAAAVVGEPWVVLEPDALPMLGDCEGQGDRVGHLKYAAEALADAGARVYVDVGHSGWLSAEEAARRLELIGFEHAVGFALNVSNYQTTADSTAYGEKVSQLTGGARFVIDTSRNGNGSDGTWCNPRGRALGERPRLVGDAGGLDALLWIKLPGESDGTCNGGPAAGQWFSEVALELARNARW